MLTCGPLVMVSCVNCVDGKMRMGVVPRQPLHNGGAWGQLTPNTPPIRQGYNNKGLQLVRVARTGHCGQARLGDCLYIVSH